MTDLEDLFRIHTRTQLASRLRLYGREGKGKYINHVASHPLILQVGRPVDRVSVL